METRYPVEGLFGSELPATCNHCGVMTASKSQEMEILWAIFAFFYKKTTPYGKIFKILSRKFTWRHRSTLLCSNFAKFVRREIGEIVRYSHDQKTKKNSAPIQTVATVRIEPKICQDQPTTFGSHCSRFHPYRVTFSYSRTHPHSFLRLGWIIILVHKRQDMQRDHRTYRKKLKIWTSSVFVALYKSMIRSHLE